MQNAGHQPASFPPHHVATSHASPLLPPKKERRRLAACGWEAASAGGGARAACCHSPPGPPASSSSLRIITTLSGKVQGKGVAARRALPAPISLGRREPRCAFWCCRAPLQLPARGHPCPCWPSFSPLRRSAAETLATPVYHKQRVFLTTALQLSGCSPLLKHTKFPAARLDLDPRDVQHVVVLHAELQPHSNRQQIANVHCVSTGHCSAELRTRSSRAAAGWPASIMAVHTRTRTWSGVWSGKTLVASKRNLQRAGSTWYLAHTAENICRAPVQQRPLCHSGGAPVDPCNHQ